MVNDFLLELGCEELPFAAVIHSANTLAELVAAALKKAQLNYQTITPFAAPRRLALLVMQLDTQQPSQEVCRRGPARNAAFDAQGKPTNALLGFAKSCQVELDQLTVLTTDKGEWLVHNSVNEGQQAANLLPQLIQQALSELPIAKPMRWGAGTVEFIRPVHWVVMRLGEQIINCQILGVQTGNISHGHRFHHPQAININQPKEYEAQLEQAWVIANFNKRRQLIIDQVQRLAEEQDAQAIMPDDLIDEVAAIVEWPQAKLASFAAEFLEVPSEALIASMQSHQKCFALKDKTGALLPYFITVTNLDSLDIKQVVAGNEKVMRARLSDAAFFYQQDKKQPLSSRVDGTKNVIFQARLGSLYDKSLRLQSLMEKLSLLLKLDINQAKRAALLSKCDLMTGMVGEFPELQGLMGYYYAHDGEPEAVAVALNEQYWPRFAGDGLPTTDLGLALSLADRLDTLVGIFAIGQKPSGVKDPFKLRRHALAVVRLLLATPTQLKLSTLLDEAHKAYGKTIEVNSAILQEVKTFILERLPAFYQSQSLSTDLVNAVCARQDEDLYDFDQRIHALAQFIHKPEAGALSAACKRVNNLLQQANKQVSNSINEQLFDNDAERALFKRIEMTEQQIKPLYEQADYCAILNHLASLREPVDAFFEQVMVMVDDQAVKHNRLALLARLQSLLQGVADISLLQNK